MAGYVIYGIKYTRGMCREMMEIKIIAIALLWKMANKLKNQAEKEYEAKKDEFYYWEINISGEVNIF